LRLAVPLERNSEIRVQKPHDIVFASVQNMGYFWTTIKTLRSYLQGEEDDKNTFSFDFAAFVSMGSLLGGPRRRDGYGQAILSPILRLLSRH
jgi:hypothetical protein